MKTMYFFTDPQKIGALAYASLQPTKICEHGYAISIHTTRLQCLTWTTMPNHDHM